MSLALALIAASAVLVPQRGQTPLDPTEYVSPSGIYALQVTPSHRKGAGSSRCRLLREGEEAWARDLAMTFWDAAIADDGWCAGYAYSAGNSSSRDANFLIVVVDPEGTVHRIAEIERVPKYIHVPSFPRGGGAYLSHEGGLAVIRVREDLDHDEWWTLDFSQNGRRVDVPVFEARLRTCERRPLMGAKLPPPPEVSVVELKPKGVIALDAEPVAADPRRLLEWAPVDGGHIDLVWAVKGAYVIEEIDPDAGVQSRRRVSLGADARCWQRLPDGTWLVAQSGSAAPRSVIWAVDEGKTEARRLCLFLGGVKALAPLPNGGFVALGGSQLQAFDRDGKSLWRVSSGYQDPAKLVSPYDVALAADGRLAVVDPWGDKVQIFSPDGTFNEAFDLEPVLAGEHHYPCDIAAAPDGDLLIYDHQGNGSLWLLDVSSGQARQIHLRFPDGRAPSELYATARYGPDGRLWASVDNLVLRFDSSGVSELEVGDAPEARRLNNPSGIAVDATGSIYVFEKKTAVVHVFDSIGGRTGWLEPGPRDFPSIPHFPTVSAASDGRVFVYIADNLFHASYVEFYATGVRSGIVQRPGRRMVFLPRLPGAWAQVYKEAVRLDGQGNEMRRIQKRANGQWLGIVEGMGVSPSGKVALSDSRGGSFAVTLYDVDAKVMVSHPIPSGSYRDEIAFGSGWMALREFGRGFLLVRESDGRLCSFEHSPEDGSVMDFLCSPDGRELWIFDREERVIERYDWPRGI